MVGVVVSHVTEYGDVVSSAPRLPPSSWNWTPTTPTLSEALAETVMLPVTVAPEVGAVMLTVGGVMSLKTVTVTGSEVYRMLSPSRPTAVKVWDPLLAVFWFQATEYGS